MFWKGYNIADLLLLNQCFFFPGRKRAERCGILILLLKGVCFTNPFGKILGVVWINNRSSVGVSANSIFYLNL